MPPARSPLASSTEGISVMFDPTTCADSSSVIFSLGLESGPSRSGGLGGPTIAPSGREVVRASLSPRQAQAQDLMTSGTSGLTGNGSSASVALQSFLENRLRQRTQILGSTLYTLTWKRWTTPSGVSRFRLRASARRTSETETTGWPTPCAMEPGTTPEQVWARKQRLTAATGVYRGNDCGLGSKVHLATWRSPNTVDAKGGTRIDPSAGQVQLCHQVKMAGWSTPDAQAMNVFADPAKHQERLDRLKEKHGNGNGAGLPIGQMVHLAGYPTPRASDGEKNVRTADGADREIARKGSPQDAAAALAGWPTCTATDATKRGSVSPRPGMMGLSETAPLASHGPARLTADGRLLTGSSAGMASGGQLSPAHSLWLMLGPRAAAWAACAPPATRSSRSRRSNSSRRSWSTSTPFLGQVAPARSLIGDPLDILV